ncbi:spirocyclase AveC family protein [Nocardia wallacei]|uniref:spirocyclase AveC family protein n=1 Tax=Nocardia wallacei TaxID=480035 RepID=UPI0022B2A172|nr:spirocyclase AveC family protein [Nocardia wallacei]
MADYDAGQQCHGTVGAFAGAPIESLSINVGTSCQWPLYEGLLWGGVQAGLCALRCARCGGEPQRIRRRGNGFGGQPGDPLLGIADAHDRPVPAPARPERAVPEHRQR